MNEKFYKIKFLFVLVVHSIKGSIDIEQDTCQYHSLNYLIYKENDRKTWCTGYESKKNHV